MIEYYEDRRLHVLGSYKLVRGHYLAKNRSTNTSCLCSSADDQYHYTKTFCELQIVLAKGFNRI